MVAWAGLPPVSGLTHPLGLLAFPGPSFSFALREGAKALKNGGDCRGHLIQHPPRQRWDFLAAACTCGRSERSLSLEAPYFVWGTVLVKGGC